MTAIWSAENRYRIWFAIEVFAAEAMGRIGMIPAEDAQKIRAAYDADVLGEIDIAAIDEIEAVTKHDVIAFLTWAGGKMGPEARYLHQGMTSSDVLDTALGCAINSAMPDRSVWIARRVVWRGWSRCVPWVNEAGSLTS